jgi:hypothetical protein
MLPGLTYDGPEPDAFLPRDAVIDLFRDYAQRIAAPVRLGTEATRIASAGGHFSVETTGGRFTAENVVLANGAFQRPRIPAASAPSVNDHPSPTPPANTHGCLDWSALTMSSLGISRWRHTCTNICSASARTGSSILIT